MATQKLRVTNRRGAITYPIDPKAVQAIAKAGGLSRMGAKQRAGIELRTVEAGGDCSDMPKKLQQVQIQSGNVEIVTPRFKAKSQRGGK